MAALGFGAVCTGSRMAAALADFCAQMSQLTGLDLQPRPVGAQEDLVARARAGDLQLMWASPLVAIELEDLELAVPLVAVERLNRLGYHAALFARSDSPLRQPADLSGVEVAWVTRDSASGYFVPRWHLRRLGMNLSDVFSAETFAGSHAEAARAVLDGRAEVGATYVGLDASGKSVQAAPWLDLGAVAGSMRVILLVGPIPADVIAASTAIGSDARRRLGGALLSIVPEKGGPARDLLRAARFDPVSSGHFALLRELAKFDAD